MAEVPGVYPGKTQLFGVLYGEYRDSKELPNGERDYGEFRTYAVIEGGGGEPPRLLRHKTFTSAQEWHSPWPSNLSTYELVMLPLAMGQHPSGLVFEATTLDRGRNWPESRERSIISIVDPVTLDHSTQVLWDGDPRDPGVEYLPGLGGNFQIPFTENGQHALLEGRTGAGGSRIGVYRFVDRNFTLERVISGDYFNIRNLFGNTFVAQRATTWTGSGWLYVVERLALQSDLDLAVEESFPIDRGSIGFTRRDGWVFLTAGSSPLTVQALNVFTGEWTNAVNLGEHWIAEVGEVEDGNLIAICHSIDRQMLSIVPLELTGATLSIVGAARLIDQTDDYLYLSDGYWFNPIGPGLTSWERWGGGGFAVMAASIDWKTSSGGTAIDIPIPPGGRYAWAWSPMVIKPFGNLAGRFLTSHARFTDSRV